MSDSLEPPEYPGPYAKPEYERFWDHCGVLGLHVYRWSVFIRQANVSWMIAAYHGGFRTRWGAQRWAKAWLNKYGSMEEVS